MMKLGMPYPSMMQMMTAQQQMLHQMMVQPQINKNEQKKNILNNTMNDILHLVFRRNESLFMVQCSPDEKISSIIVKYRMKSGDNDNTKDFIFNSNEKDSVKL